MILQGPRRETRVGYHAPKSSVNATSRTGATLRGVAVNGRVLLGLCGIALLAVSGCSSAGTNAPADARTPDAAVPGSFAALGDQALADLERVFYASSPAGWRKCVPDLGCGTGDVDWGVDSLTYALSMRWSITGDATLLPLLAALNAAGPSPGSCQLPGCTGWSDVPEWDAVAAAREYEATGDASALARAKAGFDYVDGSNAFALGACPTIDYQLPSGGQNLLKTLESDSNYIKAALLLGLATSDATYVTKAMAKYAAVRQYFLDPTVPLYTVYVFDSGTACTPVAGQYFASVNGNMIWNGLALADATGDATYRDQAIATAEAVDANLRDPAGIFEDLQAENDVAEPLVEAFYRLATTEAQPFARAWLLRNAAVLSSDRATSGSFGRFWGGPAPKGTTTVWQANGGFALAFAAAALAPTDVPSARDVWSSATFTSTSITALPGSLAFKGSAIALVGTIGEQCCDFGHADVLVDGASTFDKTGIWQNKSSSSQPVPSSILFAWRWPVSGPHTLGFQPGVWNAKQGGPFLHVTGYYVVP